MSVFPVFPHPLRSIQQSSIDVRQDRKQFLLLNASFLCPPFGVMTEGFENVQPAIRDLGHMCLFVE
jgi:hypothetical protein